MENGECGEPRGIVKNARCILVMTSAKQQPLGRIFSMHSPSIYKNGPQARSYRGRMHGEYSP